MLPQSTVLRESSMRPPQGRSNSLFGNVDFVVEPSLLNLAREFVESRGYAPSLESLLLTLWNSWGQSFLFHFRAFLKVHRIQTIGPESFRASRANAIQLGQFANAQLC